MSEAGKRLIQAAKEARAFLDGTADLKGYRIHTPAEIDARLIRRKQKMTQKQFAAAYSIDLATLRNWEQGRRCPEGPAAALLRIIDREPAAAQRALMVRKSRTLKRKAAG